jgi:hypothetical protein
VKYVILIYSNPATWGALPPEEADRVIRDHNDMIAELTGSGELVAMFGLSDPAITRTIRLDGRVPVITDGPFGEAKEQLAGLFAVDCESIDRAIEISRPLAQHAIVEVRPLMTEAGLEM